MKRVVLTPVARESLRDISQYIGAYSPAAATRIRRRLLSRTKQLAKFPESGRVVPEYEVKQIRELFEGSYRIWYRLRDDRVEVIAILHGARDLSDG